MFGKTTTTTVLETPLLRVVGTVDVKLTLPEVMVVVWKVAEDGVTTRIMFVEVPLMLVGTVEVKPILPDVTVVV